MIGNIKPKDIKSIKILSINDVNITIVINGFKVINGGFEYVITEELMKYLDKTDRYDMIYSIVNRYPISKIYLV